MATVRLAEALRAEAVPSADKNLDLIGHTRQKSTGSMAFHCSCCGFCCAPAVCRCAC